MTRATYARIGPRIGDAWDATTDVLAGRAGLLAPIAALGFFLPSAVQTAIRAYGGPTPGIAALGASVALLALGLVLWAQLAVIAVASDPATTRAQASRLGLQRLPRALLVAAVLVALFVLAVLPIAGVLLASGFDFQAAAAQSGSAAPLPVAPGALLFSLFYGLALAVAGLWLGARLFLVNAVVLNEARGLGALRRSFRLTGGLTIKLIGAALLFLLVYLVAALAAQAVVGVVFRLILGPGQIATATFLAGLAGAAVGAVFNTIVAVFAARLYVAVRARAEGDAAA